MANDEDVFLTAAPGKKLQQIIVEITPTGRVVKPGDNTENSHLGHTTSNIMVQLWEEYTSHQNRCEHSIVTQATVQWRSPHRFQNVGMGRYILQRNPINEDADSASHIILVNRVNRITWGLICSFI